MDIWFTTAAERRQLALELDQLETEQWSAATVCDGWTVKHVVAHLVTPFVVSKPRFLASMLRHRFRFDRVIDAFAHKVAQRPTAELVELLRANAENRWTPPKGGPELPLAEIVVHGQDVRAAVGLQRSVDDRLALVVLDTAGDDRSARSDYLSRMRAPAPTQS